MPRPTRLRHATPDAPEVRRRPTVRGSASTVLAALIISVLALIGSVVVGGPSTPAQAADNGLWSLTAPPDASGNVPDVVTLEAAPGALVSTGAVIKNLTKSPLTVTTGATLSNVGAAPTTQNGSGSNEATRWFRVNDTKITLAPLASQQLSIQLTIPTNAGAGDYSAQLVTYGAPVTLPSGVERTSRTVALRYDVRVTGDLKPALELSTLDVQEQLLFFRLTNAGNTVLKPTVSVEGIGTDGTPILVTDAPVGEVLPGEGQAVQIPLGTTPASLKVTASSAAEPVEALWPLAPIGAAVLTPGAEPPPPPDPGSSTASLIVFTLFALFLVLLAWWAAAGHNRRKRRLQERADLIARASLAEQRGEAAAAAAVAAAGIPTPLVVPPPLQPGQPFPPPAGAPVEAITLDLVAAGAVLIGPSPTRAPTQPDEAPLMAMAGAPFPPPVPDAMVPNDGTGIETSGAPADPASVPASGTPFPPPNGAPVG